MSEPKVVELLHAAHGYDVLVHVPPGTRTNPELASVDVSRLPGAEVVALARFEAERMVANAGCARGPSDRFAPGLEGVLFDRAQGMALGSLGVAPKDLRVMQTEAKERAYARRAVGSSERGPVVIDQALTFDGEDRDLLLCSIACVGPGCESAGIVTSGVLPEAPPPNAVVSAFFYTAEHPVPVLGTAVGIAVVMVAIILWRRPYPRP